MLDITEVRATQDALISEREGRIAQTIAAAVAEEGRKQQELFIDVTSHEMRT
jgi:hypothetical protein